LQKVPDYKERIFYISGPNVMVAAFEVNLKKIGVRKTQLKTDYFPGFA
jgi:ferredoxin-NADP reductase